MTTDTVGGVWHYSLTLCRAFRPHGVKVTLATMGRALSAQQRAAVAALPHVTCEESIYKLEWMPDPWADVAAAGRWLLHLAREARPEVVHLNGYAHGHLPFDAPVLMVAHSCVNSWWHACRGEGPPADWDAYTRAVYHGVQGAGLLVAPTATMLAAARRHYLPACDCRVIHNATDVPPGEPIDSDGKWPVVLSAGRLWDEAKNAAALARCKLPEGWELRLAGEAVEPGSNRSPPTNLTTLGHLDPAALAQEMAFAAVYALPCRYEPFGLSVLEAARNGCALLLGDIPSQRELWDGCALFVNPDDDAALQRALDRLTRDVPLRRRLVSAARRRAGPYTPAAMADGYLNAYAHLLTTHQARTLNDAPAPNDAGAPNDARALNGERALNGASAPGDTTAVALQEAGAT
ncbi:MAG: glycosyltransferase family 4 protein [Phycisphaerae bacterium]